MVKIVTLSELEANVVELVREVRDGSAIEVVDGGRPIAEIVSPTQGESGVVYLQRADPARPLKDFVRPPPLDLSVDPVQVLLELRQNDR